jgi:hypothetical protein
LDGKPPAHPWGGGVRLGCGLPKKKIKKIQIFLEMLALNALRDLFTPPPDLSIRSPTTEIG